jgi:hypothetical protein
MKKVEAQAIADAEEFRKNCANLTVEEIASVALVHESPQIADVARRYYSGEIEAEAFISEVMFGS